MRSKYLTVALANGLFLLVPGCATPEVVQVRQVYDGKLGCTELAMAQQEARDFEEKARGERGITGKNVAGALLFWPALVGTYVNTEEAIKAAQDRQERLTELSAQKGCSEA